jgi:hypothetical protein
MLLCRLRLLSLAAITLAFTSGVAVPQTSCGRHALLGVADSSGMPVLQRQAYCLAANTTCPPSLPAFGPLWTGGTAYDPAFQVAWSSNGTHLTATVLTSTTPPCFTSCPVGGVPGLPAGASVTGLAFANDDRRLYVLYTRNDGGWGLVTLDAPSASCPTLRQVNDCAGPFPAGYRPAGLAYSERRRRLILSVSLFSGAPDNHVVSLAPPPTGGVCPDLSCASRLPPCSVPLGAITGLGYDDCAAMLYATDGGRLARYAFDPRTCAVSSVDCCTAPIAGVYRGLDLETDHGVPAGAGCDGPGCTGCPGPPVLLALGDTTIGSAGGFLVRAPGGSEVTLYLSLGACGPGFPFACGFVRLGATIFVIGRTTLPLGSCTTGFVPLPIPTDYSLCGAVACAQGRITCRSGGTGLTNALCVTIGDN